MALGTRLRGWGGVGARLVGLACVPNVGWNAPDSARARRHYWGPMRGPAVLSRRCVMGPGGGQVGYVAGRDSVDVCVSMRSEIRAGRGGAEVTVCVSPRGGALSIRARRREELRCAMCWRRPGHLAAESGSAIPQLDLTAEEAGKAWGWLGQLRRWASRFASLEVEGGVGWGVLSGDSGGLWGADDRFEAQRAVVVTRGGGRAGVLDGGTHAVARGEGERAGGVRECFGCCWRAREGGGGVAADVVRLAFVWLWEAFWSGV